MNAKKEGIAVKTETTTADSKYLKTAKPIITGMLIGLVISLILLAVFSFIMTIRDFSGGTVSTLTIIAVAAGCFLGGFITAKIYGKSGLILGCITGLCMFLVLMAAGLAIEQAGLSLSGVFKLVVSVAAGGIGGIMGVNSHTNSRK